MLDENGEEQSLINRSVAVHSSAMLSAILTYLNSSENSHEVRNTRMTTMGRR